MTINRPERILERIESCKDMVTIQVEIDGSLLKDLDDTAYDLNVSRSDFVSAAIQHVVRRHQTKKLEARHALGYAKAPPMPDEFDGWEREQTRTGGIDYDE